MLDRLILLRGESNNPLIQFQCAVCGDGQNFDKECVIPAKQPRLDSITGEVDIPIIPQQDTCKTAVRINGKIDIGRGVSDDLKSDYEVVLD